MKKYFSKFLCMVLALIMVIALLPNNSIAFAANNNADLVISSLQKGVTPLKNHVKYDRDKKESTWGDLHYKDGETCTNHYSSKWQFWSQGASKYKKMAPGCRLVAQAKLLAESGVASTNTAVFNPDVYYEYLLSHRDPQGKRYIGEHGGVAETHGAADSTGRAIDDYSMNSEVNTTSSTLVRQKYITLTKNGTKDNETIMKLLNNPEHEYYIMLGCDAHYTYVGREASIDAGTTIILDSSSSYSIDPKSVYNFAEKYNNNNPSPFVWLVYWEKVTSCSHTWDTGICKKCHFWDKSLLSITAVPEGERTYRVTGNGVPYLRKGPYNECDSVVLEPNRTVTVTNIIVTPRKTTWYEISDLQGLANYNYIYSSHLEKVEEAKPESRLLIQPESDSITIVAGNVCPVLGKITTNGTLVSVSATLDGIKYAGYCPYNTDYVNLKCSSVNTDLIGSKLAIGPHTLVISAEDNLGGKKSVTIPITVNPAQATIIYPPIINYTDAVGGKRVTITQDNRNPAGTVLSYQYDGKGENNVASAVFDVNTSCDITAFSEKAGVAKSGTTTKSVVVETLDAPVVSQNLLPDGIEIVLTTNQPTDIYYSVNGNEVQKYSQPFRVNENSVTVSAYAVRPGYHDSPATVKNFFASAPSVPETTLLAGNATAAQNTAVTIGWKTIPNAASYTFSAYLAGELKATKELTGNSAAFVLQEAGDYSFTVSATNAFGTSAESAPVNVASMAPCTVRFVDWDGSVLSEQTVDYGAAAVAPADPERNGHDFLYWDQASNFVTTDMTVTPVYKIRSYRVAFEDQNGNRIGNTRTVKYNNSVEAPEASEIICPSGYKFIGWNVQPESASSSCQIVVRDGKYVLEGVDSGVTVKAIVEWGDPELPVSATITSAQRNDDSANGNYVVTVHLNGTPSQYTTTLVRVSLKTAAGKMVATEAHTVGLPAGTIDQNEVFTLKYGGTASIAEVIALGYNGDYATGSAYAPADTENITVISEYVYGPRSEWSTERPEEIEDRDIEQKVQYNTRVKSTKTSSNASEPGWELERTESNWVTGSWSAWSDTVYYPTTPTTTSNYEREVRTQNTFVKKQYQYTHYFNSSTGNTSPVKYSGWTGPHYCGNSNGEQWIDFQLEKTGKTSNADGSVIYRGYCPVCGRTTNFYHETTRDVYKTQYSYRDRNLVYTYHYYRWGNWSGWTDTPASSDSTQEVETRTVYRYRDKNVPKTAVISGDEDDSGTPHSVNGVLPVDSGTDLEGKIALIMVYKGKNSDPNESQLEYVGQTVIGEGNSYAFSFRTREEPSFATGDFVISLSIQGSSGLVNVGTIPAPKRQHYVVFLDNDNNPIPVYYNGEKITQNVFDEKNELRYSEAQIVEEGSNAIVPEAPEVAGKYFTNWCGNTTNIADDLEFTPHYEKQNYVSVYIDWVNGSVNVYEHDLGNESEAPVVEAKDGYTFLGWVEDPDSGTEHVKVYFASYEIQEFQVTFVDINGAVINTQSVPYGGIAAPPEAPEIENMIFLGWSTGVAWWNVSCDLEVGPNYIYEDTAEMPTSEIDTFDLNNPTVILIAEEGAAIYYTDDGSEPDAETAEVYTGPIPLGEDTQIRAIAVVPNKNVSETLNVDFEFEDEEYYETMPELVEIGTYTVNVVPGGSTDLHLNMSESAGMVAYLFTVECDRGVFYLDYDEETGLVTTQGEASPGGMMFCAPYEDLGYQIMWFSQDGATTAGELFSITLHVSDEAETGAYPITVSYSPSNTVTAEDVEASVDGMIVAFGAGSALLGDVNGDGIISTIDVVRIARYLIDDITFSRKQLAAADVTGDGNITASDVIRLARYLVGLAELG